MSTVTPLATAMLRCTICGKLRAFHELGIFETQLSPVLTQMVLYCADNHACRNKAQTHKILDMAAETDA